MVVLTTLGRGGGLLHQSVDSQVQNMITNWTQSDLSLCKNEGSKRSKIKVIENQGEY